MNFFSRFIIRYSLWITLLGIGLTAIGSYYTFFLFKNLKTDIEELLPTTARSVIDLKEVTSRLESTENLAILIFSKDGAASKRFVIDLAKNLEALPQQVIASVEYKIDKELKFFTDHQPLYLEVKELTDIRNFIEARINYEKELYNPINIFRSTELPEPTYNFLTLKNKYSGKVSSYTQFPEGFYANKDETIRVILVNMAGKLSGVNSAKTLRALVDEEIAKLNPVSYAADMEIKFTGGVQNLIEDTDSLIADLVFTTVIVIILTIVALLVYFRNLRGTFALITSLLMGTIWTFGVSYHLVGYLNANSAFLAGIVIGNGINFGIIFLARFLEEIEKGRHGLRAVHFATTKTATATLTAALAAGLSYGSLMLTGFRGFNQFGLIGLVGMILCWISAYTLLPAILVIINKISPMHRSKFRKKKPNRFFSNGLAWLVHHHPKKLWVSTLLITAISLVSIFTHSGAILETDLSKLRDKRSIESGSAYLSTYLDQIFKRYLSPIVVLPRSEKDIDPIVKKMKELQEDKTKKTYISAVYSIHDFIPSHQPEKIKLLNQIRTLLPPRIVHQLSAKEQAQVGQLLNPNSFQPFGQNELPEMVKGKFRERDGTIGKLVLVEPPLTKDLWEKDNLFSFIDQIRDATDSVTPGTPVAGQLAVTADMIRAIQEDGPKATLFAFLAVVILVILLFRNFRVIFLTLFGLILGVFWFGGIVMGFDLKINFLNFIALPITFGIGVDYAVNIFQRYHNEERASIIPVLRHTGGAVGLASITTVIGYGSLLIAGNQAIVSFGLLAVLGEFACLFAALISLPAYLTIQERKTSSKTLRESS